MSLLDAQLDDIKAADASIESLDSAVSPKSQIYTQRPKYQRAPSTASDIWNREREERAKAEAAHVAWLQTPSPTTAPWFPTGPGRLQAPIIIEEIRWGRDSSFGPGNEGMAKAKGPSPVWDEYASLAFDYARSQQDTYQAPLSHLEFDISGIDAHGRRVRVQKMLEVALDVRDHSTELLPFERATMQLKRTTIASEHDTHAFPPYVEDGSGPEIVLQRLAQSEVDRVLDERTHFLREAFASEEEYVQDMRDLLAHEPHRWTFEMPTVGVRGEDDTCLVLKETRSDVVDEAGRVTVTSTVLLEQTRTEGRSRLFDLCDGGGESEKRCRRARWSFGSAIDRCIASGSESRFVMDRWVDGTFRPRD